MYLLCPTRSLDCFVPCYHRLLLSKCDRPEMVSCFPGLRLRAVTAKWNNLHPGIKPLLCRHSTPAQGPHNVNAPYWTMAHPSSRPSYLDASPPTPPSAQVCTSFVKPFEGVRHKPMLPCKIVHFVSICPPPGSNNYSQIMFFMLMGYRLLFFRQMGWYLFELF